MDLPVEFCYYIEGKVIFPCRECFITVKIASWGWVVIMTHHSGGNYVLAALAIQMSDSQNGLSRWNLHCSLETWVQPILWHNLLT